MKTIKKVIKTKQLKTIHHKGIPGSNIAFAFHTELRCCNASCLNIPYYPPEFHYWWWTFIIVDIYYNKWSEMSYEKKSRNRNSWSRCQRETSFPVSSLDIKGSMVFCRSVFYLVTISVPSLMNWGTLSGLVFSAWSVPVTNLLWCNRKCFAGPAIPHEIFWE